jgi:hypothetical protein
VVCLKSVIVKPRKMRRPRPPRGCGAIENKNREANPYALIVQIFGESKLTQSTVQGTQFVECCTDGSTSYLTWRIGEWDSYYVTFHVRQCSLI